MGRWLLHGLVHSCNSCNISILHSPVATTASVLVHPEYFIGRWAGEVEMGTGKWEMGNGELGVWQPWQPLNRN